MMELLLKIVNDWCSLFIPSENIRKPSIFPTIDFLMFSGRVKREHQPLPIFAKISIIDVWRGPKCTCLLFKNDCTPVNHWNWAEQGMNKPKTENWFGANDLGAVAHLHFTSDTIRFHKRNSLNKTHSLQLYWKRDDVTKVFQLILQNVSKCYLRMVASDPS